MQKNLSPDPELTGFGCLVGRLVEWDPNGGNKTSEALEIYSDEEIFIGRDGNTCQVQIQNPFVSNKHLRIYTILFDQDNLQDIPPLVYAQDLSLNGTSWNDYKMKGKGSFLLSDGDVLRVAAGVYIRFRSVDVTATDRFTYLQRLEMKTFQDSHIVTQRVLGAGAYGRVHMAFRKDDGQQLACKITDLEIIKSGTQISRKDSRSKFFPQKNAWQRKSLTGIRKTRQGEQAIREKIAMVEREAKMLLELSHPNIIAVEKVIKSSNTIYMFTELVTCGDLFSYLRYRGGRLEETTAALIIRQVLLALDYLHDRDIVHRDLKPDNILMTTLEDDGRVVLTDFGCAIQLKKSVPRTSSIVGTLEYCAPEMQDTLKQGYTKAVDLWSLGCVTAVLLVGNTPFDDAGKSISSYLTDLETELKILNIGTRTRDFVRNLLVPDEMRRMDVKQALRHNWLAHSNFKSYFEGMYQRAIQNWRPRDNNSKDVIIKLANFTRSQSLQYVSHLRPPAKLRAQCNLDDPDHISATSYEDTEVVDAKQLLSPSTTSSLLCKRNWKAVEAKSPPTWQPLGIIYPEVDGKQALDKPIHNENTGNESAQFLGQVKREQLDQARMMRHVLYLSPFGTTTVKKKADDKMEEMEEVYEEIRNPVTGKRRRRAYGRDVGGFSDLF
ncbi:hypothetical protein N7462_003792 [Penicillium macrosclerotiorum]|uniref:uncharacterized protein n=1 Tax=Penicillium macrosclerotiorum TaxID=303699 RepID=UPI002548EE56|nr:uncharacterized protein N7462_003792 [Penicillium macrosclerotiorum]KAJ5689400.1 hypothetical protein N7462_003792 [Penicillium macrosclerotiorum]